MCKAEKLITTMLTAIAETERLFDEYGHKLSNADKAKIDLEHEIEFSNFDVLRGYKIYKRLHDVMEERRKYKNELETLGYLHEYFKKNPQIKNGLINCHRGVNTKEKMLNEAEYTPRILEDLTCTDRQPVCKAV